MENFKIGDKVEITGESNLGYEPELIGLVGTITSLANINGNFWIELQDSQGKDVSRYFVSRSFKIVEDTFKITNSKGIEFKVGDKVYFEHESGRYEVFTIDSIKFDIYYWCKPEENNTIYPEYNINNIQHVEGAPENERHNTRDYNVGESNYSKFNIQPWDIWLEYKLNPWDADIIKRVLREKKGQSRKLDYEKIIHVCQERIRQLEEDE